jgi:uncharacterized paraquat-inducible protein A
MTVSSRTPEGQPNRCPVCQSAVRMDPSQPFGDAPCPACGVLLLFAHADGETRFLVRGEAADLKHSVLQLMSARWHVSPDELASHPAMSNSNSSLDLVAAVMELEDEFGEI